MSELFHVHCVASRRKWLNKLVLLELFFVWLNGNEFQPFRNLSLMIAYDLRSMLLLGLGLLFL